MENECDAQSAFIKSSRFARYHNPNSPFSILNLFYKIKSSCPRFLLGQERIRFCGTTQIDANCVHSAHTSNNARSPDNGRSPRRSYFWPKPFALPCWKSIHTVLACSQSHSPAAL